MKMLLIFVMLFNNIQHDKENPFILRYTSRAVAIPIPVSVVEQPSARAGLFVMENILDLFNQPPIEGIEIWLPVVGYEEYYEISNLGRLRSFDRYFINNRGQNRFIKSKIMKPSFDGSGYHFVSLSVACIEYKFKIHRLVCLAFLDNPENKRCVNHINGIKTDNRLVNLEWVTHKENIAHAYAILGTGVYGERHGTTKLTESDVITIRSMNFKYGDRQKAAKQFNISLPNLDCIRSGKSWKRLLQNNLKDA